jgi:hypothetical protein
MLTKNPVVSIIALVILNAEALVFSSITNAQTYPYRCQEAISSVRKRINISLGVAKVDSIDSRPNNSPFPDARNDLQILMGRLPYTDKQLGKIGAFLNSPRLQEALAREIIMSCPSISSVTFALNHSGFSVVYGSIGSRENVVKFTCPEGWSWRRDGGELKLKWGQNCSI